MADTELNISPDEKIAGVPLARLLRNLDETSYNEGAIDLACRLTDCKAVIEELLASRATPPSPGTAPEVDVRYEFERWMSQRGESAVYIGDGLYSNGAVSDQAEAFAAGVELGRAAPASRPAEVDDEGLPPLPESLGLGMIDGQEVPAYTAEQYRQGQRDAVAADRARRGASGK